MAARKRTQAKANTPSTPRLPPVTPRRSRVQFQLVDTPTRTLRSVSHSVPRLNYYLPPLAELEADDSESDIQSLASESKHLLNGTTVPAPPQHTQHRQILSPYFLGQEGCAPTNRQVAAPSHFSAFTNLSLQLIFWILWILWVLWVLFYTYLRSFGRVAGGGAAEN